MEPDANSETVLSNGEKLVHGKSGSEVLDNFTNLTTEQQIAVVHACIKREPEYEGSRPFRAELTDRILEAESKDEIIRGFFDYVYKNKDEYNYGNFRWSEYTPPLLTNLDDWVDYVTLRAPNESLKAALSDDWEKTLTLVGMIVDRYSLSTVTENVVRQIAEVEKEPELKRQYEKVGKALIGLEPDDERTFYTSLNDLYANVEFSEYPSNIQAQEKDREIVESMINRDNPSVVVDLGCGTGRISNELASKYHEITVMGIDPSTDNLEVAKEGDTTARVDYRTGTVEQNDLGREEVDQVYILGRTLTHIRGYQRLRSAFKNLNPSLKKNGRVIFDAPDPNKGVYLKNRKRYLQTLRNLKIPIPDNDEVLDSFYWVVDSPDGGKSLYDRYVPDWHGMSHVHTGISLFSVGNRFKDLLGHTTGFKIREIDRVPIYGWEGAENIYFEAVKIE
jgi:SAM-dependent methyltransferase